MSKVIKAIKKLWHGHLHLTFEDGSMQVLTRGTHEAHELKPGDSWPVAVPQQQSVEVIVEEQKRIIRKFNRRESRTADSV